MKRDREAERALDALYKTIPDIDCKGRCQESCGPIRMTRPEWARILARMGKDATKLRDDLTCPMLAPNGRCRVYSNRPTICRLWGVVESMRCPWGCRPIRYLTHQEGKAILQAADEIGKTSPAGAGRGQDRPTGPHAPESAGTPRGRS